MKNAIIVALVLFIVWHFLQMKKAATAAAAAGGAANQAQAPTVTAQSANISTGSSGLLYQQPQTAYVVESEQYAYPTSTYISQGTGQVLPDNGKVIYLNNPQ